MEDKLKIISDAMFELQLELEPIRDKALDEKARLTGYAQCAEVMLKIIATKAEKLKEEAEKDIEKSEKIKKPKKKKAKSNE